VTTFHELHNALKCMHSRYGIGDVKEIRKFADGRVEVTAQGYGMKPHVRKGRVTY